MSWFKNLFSSPSESTSVETNVVKSMWRPNMWVMSPVGIGVIFSMGAQCEIHLVNADGETVEKVLMPLAQLRQAKWDEIPEKRRGVDRERGYKLGYF